jgi:hypothetical protein
MGNFIADYIQSWKDVFDDNAHTVYLRTDDLKLQSATRAVAKYFIKAGLGHLAAEGAGVAWDHIAKYGGNIKSTMYVQAESIVVKPKQGTGLLFANIESIEIPYKDVVEFKKSKANFLYTYLIVSTINGRVLFLVDNSRFDVLSNQLLVAKELSDGTGH